MKKALLWLFYYGCHAKKYRIIIWTVLQGLPVVFTLASYHKKSRTFSGSGYRYTCTRQDLY